VDFNHQFTVDAPLDRVWTLLVDVQQVAPCVPGAEVTAKQDDTHYRGTIKVRLGPVQMSYQGDLELDADRDDGVIILRLKGSELRGVGGASGTMTSRLTEADGRTTVDIHSHIDVSGRVAQFGRGLMQQVAGRMINQFAACLQGKLT
jgi:uncharacterized protein